MFNLKSSDHSLEIRMSTELSHVDDCIEHVRGFLDKIGRSDLFFAITLLAREALNNAMVHGNKLEQSKDVAFELLADGVTLRMQVVDQGPGFDWRTYMNKESDISEENGRGHEIYRNYAENLTYNDSGNQLTLHVRL